MDAASYAQSKVGTKPYCAPEVLSNLDLQKSSTAGRSNGLKGHNAITIGFSRCKFHRQFFFAKELGHTLSAQMFGALGFPAAFIALLW